MKELVRKINLVMGSLGAVKKEGFNKFQNYHYMAHADLMREIHPLLISNGLVIFPESTKISSRTSEEVTGNNKTSHQNRIVLETKYVITDGESRIEFYGIGEGVDSQDKSSYKAQTGAQKYALKQLFHIPDELDAEATEQEKTFTQVAREQAPENGQKPDANSMLKAGKIRANSIIDFIDNNLFTEAELKRVLQKYKVDKPEDLSKTVADAIIAVCVEKDKKLKRGE